MSREQADITKVEKRGEGYTIKGVSKGRHAEFHVDARTLDRMPHKEAEAFMKRTIHNLSHSEEE